MPDDNPPKTKHARHEMLDEFVVLSPGQVGFILGVSEQHIVNMLKEKQLKGTQLGRRWLVPRCALDPFLGIETNETTTIKTEGG